VANMNYSSCHAAARSYAERGWPVLPVHTAVGGRCSCGKSKCATPAKHPITPNGLKDATTDPATIDAWWSESPQANVAIRTGACSGLGVMDIDPRKGGEESLHEIVAELGELPVTVEALTGGDGRHLLFDLPGGGLGNRVGIRPGIDFRGDGGYIVAAPSLHSSGGVYRWRAGYGPGERDAAALPPALAAVVRKAARSQPRTTSSADSTAQVRDAAARYVAAAAFAVEGGRNSAAFSLAGHVAAFQTTDGARLTEFEIVSLLCSWNCGNSPPLADSELAQVVHSAMRNGKPRAPHPVGTRISSPPSTEPARNPKKNRVPLTLAPKFRPFPVEVLPEPVRTFVTAGAAAIGCDPSFVALPTLTVLASAIGNTFRIELKSGWTEPACLWTAVVGASGTLKTPAVDLPLKSLRDAQAEAIKDYESQIEQHEKDMANYEAQLRDWRGKKPRERGDPPRKPKAPIPINYLVGDVTVEGLAPILAENPRGTLLVRDELAGWIGSFDRYAKGGKGGDSAHWLSMHAGKFAKIDRKTGTPRTIFIPRALVSVTGGIQPEVLNRVLGREHRENGLAARLLLTYPPRKPRVWTEAEIDPALERKFGGLVLGLMLLQPGTDEKNDPTPRIVRLGPAAKRAWVKFFNAHAREQVELLGDEAAAWSKLEGYAARFALIIHLVRKMAGDPTLVDPDHIDEQSIEAGIALSQWFGYETRRVYALLSESDAVRAHRGLIELIERRGGRITARQLQQSDRHLGTSEAAERVLQELVDAGVGDWQPVPPAAKGGQPTRVFVLADSTHVYGTSSNPDENMGSVDGNGESRDA
jgi:hypothetical protein